ncbi:copper resistance protein B [Acinetobacter sp. B51(2017)]|uniref:copper resistance protein B n=1 Tax=Acinetobacter sp. B51(2017) TaxID=2060938 RepID=UPI000F079A58|nr:copper resistance protein B [Acinetobacter sp. B51(2017)]
MHITNFALKATFSVTLLSLSTLSLANAEHHTSTQHDGKDATFIQQHAMSHSQHSEQEHQQIQANHTQQQTKQIDHYAGESAQDDSAHHDHRKEHGAQIYAVTTLDHQWLVNNEGEKALKSEFETRIGTDENKLFIKVHANKQESHNAHYDAKILYSRMILDFWDAQLGTRYRSENIEGNDHHQDNEEYIDAVIGLHGMAPYFFETDAYAYVGKDRYIGFSLKTERDFLMTQKLMIQPYLELDLIFNDETKYAKKTGLNRAMAGIETRYEISKKVMPYLNVVYQYSKGNDETRWQKSSSTEKDWLYGAGIRFKF